MERIQDLIERDLSRQIEEIIKVYQDDEQTIYEEITEYVPTDNIKDHLADTLGAIAKSPQTHQKIEKMGLWISGFFGSGKSSFAKNLGLILSNPQICGSNASELFKKKFDDQRISSYIDNINARIPAKVIMFDIANTSYVRKGGKELISEVMYRSLLENLGYSKDFDIAELEIWLEQSGRYDDFLVAYNGSTKMCPGKKRETVRRRWAGRVRRCTGSILLPIPMYWHGEIQCAGNPSIFRWKIL